MKIEIKKKMKQGIALLLTLVIVIGGLTGINAFAKDNLPDATVSLGERLDWNGAYDTEIFVGGTLVYCMQALKNVPGIGSVVTQNYYENKDVLRTLYYGWGGVERWSGFTSYAHGYVLTSRILSHYYSGFPSDAELTSAEKDFIKFLESKPYIEPVGFNKSKVIAVLDESKGIQITPSVKLTGTGSVIFNLPERVTLVNETKGIKHTGKVTLSGETDFHFEASADYDGGTWSSGKVGSTVEYVPVVTNDKNGNESVQTCVYLVGKSDLGNASLDVEFKAYGKLRIEKGSANTGITEGNACYSLEGAIFEIYDKNNKLVDTVTTDKDGYAGSKWLAQDGYTIKEIKAPKGYILITDKISVNLNKGIVTKQISNVPANDPIDIVLGKVDAQTNKNKPQGSASLENAEFTIKYYDGFYGTENDLKGKVATRIWVFKTNSEGKTYFLDNYKVGGDNLYYMEGNPNPTMPLGTVTVQETKAPKGYKLNNELFIRQIKSSEGTGEIIQHYNEPTVEEQVYRGDLELIKVSDSDMKRLANVPFKITSKVTGESHVIVTDNNGYASTASSWNLHSQNTNRGEKDEDGVWFGESAVDDNKGALIYDTYLIEELRCEANEKYDLISPFEIVISRDNYKINLGTLTNDYTPEIPKIEIKTTAKDKETETNQSFSKKETTIIDTVSYINLVAGKEYTIKGILMSKSTGKPLIINGKEIVAEKTFIAETINGSIDLYFTFDASGLKGQSVVVFERVYDQNEEIAVHTDIEDRGQTVDFPGIKIGTKARDKETGMNKSFAKKEVTIIDTVSYSDLIIGKEYTIKGILMDKATGKPLLIGNKEISAEKIFIAKTANGNVDLEFTFDGSGMKGKTVVVFERLYHQDVEIAVHADIEDRGQTVDFPEIKIGTKARDKETGMNKSFAKKEVTIIDTVSYTNLIIGKEYTVKGILMDKAIGKPLLIGNKKITAAKTFIAKTASGSVDLKFSFDGHALKGKTVVVFEKLYYQETEIAVHTDINDRAQTVNIVDLPSEKTKEVIAEPVRTGDNINKMTLSILEFVTGFAILTIIVIVPKVKKGKRKISE